jgi:hypothetical protein
VYISYFLFLVKPFYRDLIKFFEKKLLDIIYAYDMRETVLKSTMKGGMKGVWNV